jgi:GDPmannose 4,6-dehydratase
MICGIGGQDGAYLAKHLLDLGYEVVGTSRDATASSFANLIRLGINDKVAKTSMATSDFRSVLSTIKRFRPDEIYNLAGQSSVGLSFGQPVETLESIALGTINFLESIRFLELPIRFYNAGSSECFGDTGDVGADEDTPFRPRSPYAVAKATAHYLVANYREAYNIHCCTGILFNHESPLRPERFVTQKIIRTAMRIADGIPEKLSLGNIDIKRDWGWAPEYVTAMHLLLQQEKPEDFVIATGRTVPLIYFVERAFGHFGLDWNRYVELDASLIRPSDIRVGSANPSKAYAQLGWKAQTTVEEIVDKLIVEGRKSVRADSDH